MSAERGTRLPEPSQENSELEMRGDRQNRRGRPDSDNDDATDLGILLLAASRMAPAVSFDCAKAKTLTKKTICSSKDSAEQAWQESAETT
jgi:hypothetical protein